jgi:hypothetical protein
MDCHRVYHRRRDHHSAHPVATATDGSAQLLRGRDHRFHHHVGVVRHGHEPRSAHHLSRAARLVRRRTDLNRTSDHARHVSGKATGAQSSPHVNRGCGGPVDRTDARRRLDRLAVVELDLLRQHSRRHRLRIALRHAAARPGASRTPVARRGRAALDGHGLGLPAIRPRRRRTVRLVQRRQHRRNRGDRGVLAGGVRLLGVAGRSSTCGFSFTTARFGPPARWRRHWHSHSSAASFSRRNFNRDC